MAVLYLGGTPWGPLTPPPPPLRASCTPPSCSRRTHGRGLLCAVAVVALLLSVLSSPAGAQRNRDASLGGLSVSPVNIEVFDPAVTAYAVGVSNSVSQATVFAAPSHHAASVEFDISDADGSMAGHQVNLSPGVNTLTITVRSEVGSKTKNYTLTIGRGVTADFGWKATDDVNSLRAAGNDTPVGLWGNESNFWVVESDNPWKVYAYRRDGTRDPRKDIAVRHSGFVTDVIVGMWSDGQTAWIVAYDDLNDVYVLKAHRLSDGAPQPNRDFLLHADNARPEAMWSDGSTIWVIDAHDLKAYAYMLSTQARMPGRDFTLHADNGNPTGVWSDGVTFWISDNDDAKLYAYGFASGARTAAKDFDTLSAAGNQIPRGIWSDGKTMWVADNQGLETGKVYSYNMPRTANADLSTLTIGGIKVAGFAADTLNYNVNTGSRTRPVTVNALPKRTGADIVITPPDANLAAPGHQVRLGRETSVRIAVAPGTSATKTYMVTFNSASLTDPPVFGHTIGSMSLRVDEGYSALGTEVAQLSAVDPDDPTAAVTFTVGAAGAEYFKIVPLTATTTSLRVKKPLDFETQSVFRFAVAAADAGGAATSDIVTIHVNNVDDAGRVRQPDPDLPAAPAEVGVPLRVELTDPDGGVRDVTWRWYRGDSFAGTWTPIVGASSASYAPRWDDTEKDLRAQARYTDNQGAGKRASYVIGGPPACDGTLGVGRVAIDENRNACVILDTVIVKIRFGYDIAEAAQALDSLDGWSVTWQLSGLHMIILQHSPDNLSLSALNSHINAIRGRSFVQRAEADTLTEAAGDASTGAGGFGTGGAGGAVAGGGAGGSQSASLTAQFTSLPSSHDGDASFTVRVSFSEDISIGYRDFRDHVFSVTGGSVTEAHRVDGRRDLWEMTVEPEGDEEVVIAVPVTSDCDASGAVCTSDGAQLSEEASITVAGPAVTPPQQLVPEESQVDDDAAEEPTDSSVTSTDPALETALPRVPTDPPATPTNLQVAANAADSITIAWDNPGDATIIGYEIQRRRPGHGERTLLVYVADTESADTTFTDNAIEPDTRYVYRVKAINAAGVSQRSNYVRIDTPPQ